MFLHIPSSFAINLSHYLPQGGTAICRYSENSKLEGMGEGLKRAEWFWSIFRLHLSPLDKELYIMIYLGKYSNF